MADRSDFDADEFLAECKAKHKREGRYLRHPYERDSPVELVDDPKIREAWALYLERMAARKQTGGHHGR